MIELLGRENVKVSSDHMSEILKLLRQEEEAKIQEALDEAVEEGAGDKIATPIQEDDKQKLWALTKGEEWLKQYAKHNQWTLAKLDE